MRSFRMEIILLTSMVLALSITMLEAKAEEVGSPVCAPESLWLSLMKLGKSHGFSEVFSACKTNMIHGTKLQDLLDAGSELGVSLEGATVTIDDIRRSQENDNSAVMLLFADSAHVVFLKALDEQSVEIIDNREIRVLSHEELYQKWDGSVIWVKKQNPSGFFSTGLHVNATAYKVMAIVLSVFGVIYLWRLDRRRCGGCTFTGQSAGGPQDERSEKESENTRVCDGRQAAIKGME